MAAKFKGRAKKKKERKKEKKEKKKGKKEKKVRKKKKKYNSNSFLNACCRGADATVIGERYPL